MGIEEDMKARAERIKLAHDDFVITMRRHGIVDGAFVGVTMLGETVSSFTYGFEKPDISNIERGERLVGSLEVLKGKIVNYLNGIRTQQ